VGKWEGGTLVIDTTNQNGKTWFDMAGNFTTQGIHVVERVTPVDTNNISYEAVVDDATTYTQPWKIAGQIGRHPDKNMELMEFACVEGNQDLVHYTGAGGKLRKSPIGFRDRWATIGDMVRILSSALRGSCGTLAILKPRTTARER
jgi:hypothetical protein